MKLYLDGYEIDVKAKFERFRGKYNEQDTNAFLNRLSLALQLAVDERHLNECSFEHKLSCEIYTKLYASGYYKPLEGEDDEE